MREAELENRLFATPGGRARTKRPLPDWSEVHKEMKQKGVALALLWEEYKQEHPDGYLYTQYCEYYRRWKKDLGRKT